MRLFLPKSFNARFINHGDGTATYYYSECVTFKKEKEAKMSAAGARYIFRKMVEGMKKKTNNDVIFKELKQWIDRKGNKVYAHIKFVGPVEWAVKSLIRELKMQITPMKQIKVDMNKDLDIIIDKKEKKKIREKAIKIREKYKCQK